MTAFLLISLLFLAVRAASRHFDKSDVGCVVVPLFFLVASCFILSILTISVQRLSGLLLVLCLIELLAPKLDLRSLTLACAIQMLTLFAGLALIACVVQADDVRIRDEVRQMIRQATFGIHKRPEFAALAVMLLHTFGIALCISEGGTAVGFVLNVSNVNISVESEGRLKHGALIGALERILIYIFVMHEAYNAAAFILTAKTIVRFKELVHEDDSEYVLVGTLTSTAIAIAIALFVKYGLN